MRKLLAFIFLATALFFVYNFKYSYKKEYVEPNIDRELRKIATKELIESRIAIALKKENIDEAISYFELANYLHIPIDKKLKESYKELQTPIKSTMRTIKEFANGFITGKSRSGASLGGSVVSDFTLVGDLRDSYNEGKKYLNSEPYDKFLLNISLVGLALSATNVTTLGGTTTFKVGASVTKTAYKSGKLTKGFIKTLDKKLAHSIDLKLLKEVNFSSFSKMQKSIKAVAKSINPKPLKSLFKQLNAIKKNTSLSDSVKLLKYIESEKDLAKLVKLSSKYKKGTLAVVKTLGKRVFRAGKVVVKYTTKFMLNIAGFVLSVFGFLLSLFIGKRVLK